MAWRNRHILQKEVDETLKKYSGPYSELNRISLDNFFKETKLDIFIWSCKMGAVDCTLLWEPIDTFLGVCHRLQPSKVQARSFFGLNIYIQNFTKFYKKFTINHFNFIFKEMLERQNAAIAKSWAEKSQNYQHIDMSEKKTVQIIFNFFCSNLKIKFLNYNKGVGRSLSFTVGYNQTDTTYGWKGPKRVFQVYYTTKPLVWVLKTFTTDIF